MNETRSDHDNTWKAMARKAWKLSLTQRLYEQGYGREEVFEES